MKRYAKASTACNSISIQSRYKSYVVSGWKKRLPSVPQQQVVQPCRQLVSSVTLSMAMSS
jgi:hypothetical protein